VCLAQPPNEKSAVAGRVVSAATGAPLKKASVWLETFSPTRGVNGAPTVALPATVTDSEGRFTLDGVDPGSYLLLAQRTGYLDQGYGAPAPQLVGPPLDLAAGETMRDITVKLTPQSLLYGKVLDEDGEPMPNAQVQVLRASYAGGRRHLVEAGSSPSQDDGSFVVGNLTPGRYYVSAGFRKVDEAGPPARKPEREKYVTTYFPTAADSASAAPVEVGPGAEVRDVAIRLRKSRVFHIRGRLVDADSGGPAQTGIQLIPANETLAGFAAVGTQPGVAGRFEFSEVLPGAYIIQTDNSRGVFFTTGDDDTIIGKRPPNLIGRADVTVTDGDLEDVVIKVGQGAAIAGKLKGASVGRVTLTAAKGAQNGSAADVRADGAFEIRHILPDVYTLDVDGLPEGSYVKSVNFAGRPVEDWKIDLTSGSGGLLLVEVSPDAGEVAGTVRSATGEPVAGATVQLWPAGGDTARTAKSGARGEFRFRSLPPADYRIAAWQDLDDDLAQYPPFRAAFAGDAAKAKVAEGARERVELKVIGRDAIAAEAAKLK
jgi:protocatechuate 3,4-dioxygenase beta subunit